MNRAFTLIELLVVIAIVGLLAALLLPVLSRAKSSAKRTTCTSNVRQINLAITMYASDHADEIGYSTNVYYSYKDFVAPYIGLATNSQTTFVFVCPADTSLYAVSLTHYSSYGFNGTARGSNDFGMAQRKFSTVHEPSKTALDGEISGGIGVSWHNPKPIGQYNNAPNFGGFVDGHVSYIKIFWDGRTGVPDFPFFNEPPAGYEYKWTGN
jgi:prepilin-type N-terminal cleavage/methylation domain-containing protein